MRARAWAPIAALLIACTQPRPDRPGLADESDSETGGEPPVDLARADTSDDEGSEGGPDLDGCPCPTWDPEAGFVELPAGDYELGLGANAMSLSSTATRQFWAFQPADEAPADAPVFVLFNGGPAVSSGMLLGLNTGRASFDPTLTGADQAVVDNPHSWTSLGNLLWIDARQTGFSYGLLDAPGDVEAREAAMSVSNFNAYRDAADFVLTLLAFLAAHPELQDNPIVLVAESYGGTRAQVMLDMVLHPAAYADGSRRLKDPALVDAIAAHHAAVHGGRPGPEQIAAQFGRQILIQPALTGVTQQLHAGLVYEQPGSIVEQLAAELGADYSTCAELGGACNPYDNALNFVAGLGRSGYDVRASASWLDDLFALVRDRLADSSSTEALLGVGHASIVGLAAAERGGAWRAIDLGPYPADADVGDWPAVAGPLEPWDRYFLTFNAEALNRFRGYTARTLEVDPADPHFGELLLSNLIWVDTLITDAAYDVVVYTPAIATALASYESLVSGVWVDADAQEWLIEYAPELGVGPRTVAVPRYESSHAVTLDQPGLVRDDVAAWLASP